MVKWEGAITSRISDHREQTTVLNVMKLCHYLVYMYDQK